eukprot:CAMPEP_0182419848 /NCGR_PEP_ID=MMETSP1167-20130531/4199_1 /TAXON_ID=2988 /ORGANISM="Mallomonas Sp, Strain CCMP3275" /LENGTH=243 /DNA_ID=CAMNT_0024594977 /DNA_START=108 /DNA_END=839 /DNA_ORIENTATION=+
MKGLSWTVLIVSAAISSSIQDSYNLIISPKTRECFYDDFDGKAPRHVVEAFVQTGGGNVDLTLQIFGPLPLEAVRSEAFGNPISEKTIDSSLEMKSDTQSFVLHFEPNEEGTYAFCLDNRKSHFIPKLAQLDIYIAPKTEEEEEEEEAARERREHSTNETEESLQRVKESIERIQRDLVRIQLQQRRDRHRLALHSEANDISHNRVIISSLVETFVFVCASLFQIFFVRRWFSSRGAGKKGKT